MSSEKRKFLPVIVPVVGPSFRPARTVIERNDIEFERNRKQQRSRGILDSRGLEESKGENGDEREETGEGVV